MKKYVILVAILQAALVHTQDISFGFPGPGLQRGSEENLGKPKGPWSKVTQNVFKQLNFGAGAPQLRGHRETFHIHPHLGGRSCCALTPLWLRPSGMKVFFPEGRSIYMCKTGCISALRCHNV